MPGKFWERVVIRKRGNANPTAALSEKLGVTQTGSGSVNADNIPDDDPGDVSSENTDGSLGKEEYSIELPISKLMTTDITSNNSIR